MTQPNLQTYFFTADLHLGHGTVADQRGFASVRDHDDAVLHSIASCPARRLWVLGDVAFDGWQDRLGGLREATARFDLLYLVLGNHDRAHPCNRNGRDRHWAFREVFDTVLLHDSVRMGGTDVLVSHFPYDGDTDGDPDRHTQWRLRDEGLTIIHGHTHSTERVSWSRRNSLQSCGTLQLHAGWDAWRRPVSLETLSAYATAAVQERLRGERQE